MNKLGQQECLELAKKCGLIRSTDSGGITLKNELLAYTSAIEEKYQAQNVELQNQIAMLVSEVNGALKVLERMNVGAPAGLLRIANNPLQQLSDAFIAEVRAGERKTIADWMDAHSISHVSANWLRSPSAELRNQAQAEGKSK